MKKYWWKKSQTCLSGDAKPDLDYTDDPELEFDDDGTELSSAKEG